jgi:hypothetical protein
MYTPNTGESQHTTTSGAKARRRHCGDAEQIRELQVDGQGLGGDLEQFRCDAYRKHIGVIGNKVTSQSYKPEGSYRVAQLELMSRAGVAGWGIDDANSRGR